MDLVEILDRSGSMISMISDAIGGYNSYVAKMKEEFPDAKVSLVLFDDQYQELYFRKPIAEVPELTSNEYFANGMTALNDAIVRIVSKVEAQEDVDKDVAVFIMTDGYENSSRESTTADVKDLISRLQKEKDWLFTFAGANIDAFTVGGNYGVTLDSVVNYEFNTKGLNKTFNATALRSAAFLHSTSEDGLSRGVNLETFAETYEKASEDLTTVITSTAKEIV